MQSNPLLGLILRDEAITRGLGDAEARILIEWLVEHAERWFEERILDEARFQVQQWCRRARAITRFVWLWCLQQSRGAAAQLAATERFDWPMPTPEIEAYDLMRRILSWEGQVLADQEMT